MFFASTGFHRLKHPPIRGNFAASLARTSSQLRIIDVIANRVTTANPLSLFVQLWRLLQTFPSLWLLVAHNPRLSWTCVLNLLFCVVDSVIFRYAYFFSIPLAQTLAYSLIKGSGQLIIHALSIHAFIRRIRIFSFRHMERKNFKEKESLIFFEEREEFSKE